MEILICWISKVPNVIWSAIIASCLTFIGVLWTNKGNERRQMAILMYEKEKFQSEQKMSLKKEVFLNVASSLANVLEVVPKLMNLDFSDKEIDARMGDHSGILAKSYLAAKEESVASILNYSAETAETLLNLMKDRAVILDHKKSIETYQTTIDSANSEKNRIISIIKEYNIQGLKKQETFDYLNQNYELQDNIVKKFTVMKENKQSILRPLHINFAKKCIEEHGRLLSLLPPVTIALRNELDNGGNSEIFITALNTNILRMKTAFDNFLEDAKA